MLKIIITALFMLTFIFNSCTTSSKQIRLNNKKVEKNVNMAEKEQLLNILNSIREKENNCSQAVSKLDLDKELSLAAQKHAEDMAYNHFVRHDGSGTETDEAKKKLGIGSMFNERLVYFGFRAPKGTISGENVVKIDIEKGADTLKSNFKRALYGLSLSKSQCQILMNPDFKYVGIGYYKDNNSSYYWTLDYAQEKSK